MTKTLAENVQGIMDYLGMIEPKRKSEREATRRHIADLVSRVDDLEAELVVVQERLNELE